MFKFWKKKNVRADNTRRVSGSTHRAVATVPAYRRPVEGIDVVSSPSAYVPSGGYSTPDYAPYSAGVEPSTFSVPDGVINSQGWLDTSANTFSGGGGGSGFDGGGAGGSWDSSSSESSSD